MGRKCHIAGIMGGISRGFGSGIVGLLLPLDEGRGSRAGRYLVRKIVTLTSFRQFWRTRPRGAVLQLKRYFPIKNLSHGVPHLEST